MQIRVHNYKTKISFLARPISVVLLFLCLLGSGLSAQHVDAEPAASDPVAVACRQAVSKAYKGATAGKIKVGCNGDVITAARNLATYHCKGKSTENSISAKDPDSAYTKCVKDKAIGYIQDATKQKLKDANDFSKAIDKTADKIGGSTKHPADASQTGKAKEVYSGDPAVDCNGDQCDFIAKYVNPSIQLFSVIFGIVAVISIILGGIQYSASSGDPQKVANAKQRISRTFVAILAYFMLYSFIQFIVPGGLFAT